MIEPDNNYKGIYCETYDKAKKETIEKVVEILVESGAKKDSDLVKKVKKLDDSSQNEDMP